MYIMPYFVTKYDYVNLLLTETLVIPVSSEWIDSAKPAGHNTSPSRVTGICKQSARLSTLSTNSSFALSSAEHKTSAATLPSLISGSHTSSLPFQLIFSSSYSMISADLLHYQLTLCLVTLDHQVLQL